MILTNANIVLNNEVVLGSLKIEDGKIQAIDTGKMALASAVDCQGGYLMPGLVELHTDIALPVTLASQLDLAPETRVHELRTRRLIEGEPVCLIRHYLFELPDMALDAFSGGSLHKFLRDEWGISLRRGTTRLRARMPTLDECTQLTMSRGIPVMEVHTHNHCRDTGVLREYSIARSRSDLFEYSVEPKP
jgi:DNA-binding GntR family transcriptional regulator